MVPRQQYKVDCGLTGKLKTNFCSINYDINIYSSRISAYCSNVCSTVKEEHVKMSLVPVFFGTFFGFGKDWNDEARLFRKIKTWHSTRGIGALALFLAIDE